MTTTVRPPRQERSRRSTERVLTTGAELLAEKGYDGFAIAELCRRAQVSAGALYDRFAGKDALILAIHDHSMQTISATGVAAYADDTAWEGLDIADLIERAIGALLEHFQANAALLKVFVLRSAVDEEMQRRGAASVARVADAFTARLLVRAAELPHPDPEVAIKACFAIAFESASWHVAFGAMFDPAVGTDVVGTEERLPVICRLYLLTPPAAS